MYSNKQYNNLHFFSENMYRHRKGINKGINNHPQPGEKINLQPISMQTRRRKKDMFVNEILQEAIKEAHLSLIPKT